jgi:hypothetical protein
MSRLAGRTRAAHRRWSRFGALPLAVGLLALATAWAAEEAVRLSFAPPVSAEGSPPGWKPLTFEKIPAHTRYRVVPDGGGYALRAESRAAASGMIRPLDLDARTYRVITWRWKVENLLARADARRKEGDDYPARVYVAFRYDPDTASFWERTTYGAARLLYGEYPPKGVINYIWDNRLPVGSMLDNAYTDRAKMVVVESGPDKVGRWVEVERDLYEDYRRLFGSEPPRIAGVAVMTDTDNTGESAVAYYGEIVLRAARGIGSGNRNTSDNGAS